MKKRTFCFAFAILVALAASGCGPAPSPTTAPPTPGPGSPTPMLAPSTESAPGQPTIERVEGSLANTSEEVRGCLRRAWGDEAYAEMEASVRQPTTEEDLALAACSALATRPTDRPVPSPNDRVIPVSAAREAWLPIPTESGFLPAAVGPYADAEILALPGGGFRLYVEALGAHDIVSFFSEDGLIWAREEGVRIANAAFPDAVRLPDGRVRLYFQGAGVILSAISEDGGLTFVIEPGVRIERGWHGDLDPDNVGASTTVRLPDGRFRMYYRAGDHDDAYVNRLKSVILSAISDDGLTWNPEEGVRLDPGDWVDPGAPANARYLDGPEAVLTEDGRVKLYFWGVAVCSGVCLSVSEDGLTFETVEEVYAILDSPGRINIGDPTVLPFPDGAWLMYYGHAVGDDNGIWIAQRVRSAA